MSTNSSSVLGEHVAIPVLSPPPPVPTHLNFSHANVPPPLAPVVDSNTAATETESKEVSEDEEHERERFKSMKLPVAWQECPLSFDQPIEGHRLLVCKTPIDADIAEHFKIPKSNWFLPHMLYTLAAKSATGSTRKIGLVIDLTNQAFYDEISFNQGKKANKVKRRVLVMEDLSTPSDTEVLSFIGLVRSFFDGAHNQEKWIVVHDDLGYNLTGFMCAAYMVKELCYSVDAAVYQYSKMRKPGIFEPHLIRMLHTLYSEPEDIEIFEKLVGHRPMAKPAWMPRDQPPPETEFARPVSSLQQQQQPPRKRNFSQMNTGSAKSDSDSNDSSHSSHHYASVQEPMQFSSLSMDGGPSNDNGTAEIVEPVIVEPTFFGDSSSSEQDHAYDGMEPPLKRSKPNPAPPVQAHVPPELKEQHPYLVAVRGQHLQHLTSIVLQLSKNKDMFHSIQHKPATVPQASLMNLRHNYRISWLGKGYHFWLMILGKSGCFLVDPQYFATGKLGGIYHIEGTTFFNEKNTQYLDGTLCCGELVVDHILKDKQSNEYQKVPRFLITDVLVIGKQSFSKFPHPQRLQHAENDLYRPYAKSLAKSRLRIRVKPMYGIESPAIVEKLQKMIEKELPHECDGLGLFPIKPPFGQRLLRMQL